MMVRWLLGMKNNHSKSGTSTLRLLTTILHSDGDLTEQGKIRYVIDGNVFMSDDGVGERVLFQVACKLFCWSA